jgi:plasmid stabilization system protein ParE
MKYKIFISEAAEFDINESYFWYEKKQPQLGENFKNQVVLILNRIEENPLIFQVKYSKIRVAFINKFPYGIHFIIENEKIIVLAVFHTSINPKNG